MKLSEGKVHAAAEDPPLYCGQHTWVVEFEGLIDGVHYGALAATDHESGGDGKWHTSMMPGAKAKSWVRRADGQIGRIASDRPQSAELAKFGKTFQNAIDACLA